MKIAASLMCADQKHIMRNVISLVKSGIDYLHIDIIDGLFADNLAFNIGIIKECRELTRIPFDVHLMVREPSKYFDQLIKYDVDIIIFHIETKEDILKNINYLKSKEVQVGLAINLETTINEIEEYLPYINYVLIMNVRTGFSGLPFNDVVYKKINDLYSYIQNNKLKVQIISDGGIRLEHIQKLYDSGADIVVAGSSLIFNEDGLSNNIERFKNIIFDPSKRKVSNLIIQSLKNVYKAAVLKQVNDISLENRELRPLQEDEVVVKVMSCGICSSDITRVFKKGMYSNNLVPGHEFSGLVIKTKDKNRHLLNQRVVVYPLIPCKNCKFCRMGKYNLCEKYDYLGSRCDGGFAEMCIVPAENVFILPNNINYNNACLIEPLAVVYNGLKKINKIVNSNALILGLGPIGLLTGILLKRFGAGKVVGIDRDGYRLNIAKNMEFDECFPTFEGFEDKKFDLLVDCSGSSEIFNDALKYIDKQSTILILANYEEGIILNSSSMSNIMRGELNIISSWNSVINDKHNNDWKFCMDYISKNEIKIDKIITHTFSLDQIDKVLNMIKNKDLEFIKVIINP